MSRRVQIVLPDPVADQLYELAAGADTPPSTVAAQMVRNGVAQAAKDGKVRPVGQAPVLVGGSGSERPRGLSPTAATPHGAGKCGAQSSRSTAATRGRSAHSKKSGGPTRSTPRPSARSRYGERNSTTPPETPAKSSRSKPSSPTTPRRCAGKAAASPRFGSPERRPRSGRRDSRIACATRKRKQTESPTGWPLSVQLSSLGAKGRRTRSCGEPEVSCSLSGLRLDLVAPPGWPPKLLWYKLYLVSPDRRLWCKWSSTAVLLVGSLALVMFFFGRASAVPLFPTPVELVPGGEQPRVAISAGGQVAAVWMHGFRNGISSGEGCCYNTEVEAVTGSALSGVWQTPATVSMPGFSILPEVAVDAQGDAAAVWLDSYPQKGAIDASYRSASSGEWQAPVAISAPGEGGASRRVLLEPNGDAVAVWERLGEGPSPGVVGDEIAVRTAATGVWQPPHEFAAGESPGDLQIAVDARGDLFAAWVSEGVVDVAMQPAGSAAWQTPVRLSPPSLPSNMIVRGIELAVDPAGNAAVLWQQDTMECPAPTNKPVTPPCALLPHVTTLKSSVRLASTREWSEPVDIASASELAAPPVWAPNLGVRGPLGDQDAEIAIDSRGDTVATWLKVERAGTALQVSVRPAGASAWHSPSTLSPAGGFPYGARDLAVDADGQALVAWNADGVIQGSVGSATTGQWQPPVDVTSENAGPSVGEPHVAVNEAGDAVLLWSGYRAMGAITFNLSGGVPGYRPPEPAITKARMSNRRFRVRGPATSGLPPIGSRFRFRLFPEARVKVTIEQLVPGRRQGSTCLPSRDTSPRAPRRACYLTSLITTFDEGRERAGIDSIPFAGTFHVDIGRIGSTAKRVSRTRYLKPGLYAAVLTATNTSGTSAPVRLRFTVVR
jgi:hypothetical protein